MVATLKGWNQKLMISGLAKEASYDAAVTPIDATKWIGITQHSDYNPDFADEVVTDKDCVTGTEHGTNLDIISKGYKLTIEQKNALPSFVTAMAAAGLGSITASQDPGKTAYRQKCVPVTVGTALPSFNTIGTKGGLQYLAKGCMVNSFSLSGEEKKPVSCSAEIIGSGTRSVDATSFVAAPTESWLLMANGYLWLEQDANISIDAANTQGTENISSATPDDLKARFRKFNFKWNNNLIPQYGMGAGNGGVAQGMDYGRRSAELSLTLLHADATELGYFDSKTILGAEIEVKGALIAAGGTMYYGFNLVIPRFKLKKAPLPQGGVGDILTLDLEADIQDDGTNPAVIFNGYTAIAAFFA